MITKDISSINSIAHRIVVASKDSMPVGVTEELKTQVESFLSGEADFAVTKDLEGATFFIKYADDAEKMRKHGAKVRAELDRKVEKIACFGDDTYAFDALEGFLLASYKFTKYFTKNEEKENLLKSIVVTDDITDASINELMNTTKAVSWARDMVNEPVSFLNAEQLSEEIRAIGSDAGLSVTVLEKSQIESLKMGGLLAVNQGSIDPPTFMIIEHKPDNATNEKPIVLVGKGVVYDTGGLSIKPTPNSMDIMKSDMGGAACMAGAIYLAALQKLPLHIVCLIPATDNRPGLNAYAPGDVVTMYNGSTVEVLNTDAEGRMILADALAYSKKYDPEVVIDAATLTGAAHRAIGAQASIIMGNADDKYFADLEKAGNEVYERTVRFPFWDEYLEEMKSDIADLKNLGGPTAGMITAGKFLEQFVEAPYVHMDIAGPAWMDRQDAYRTKGGSGVGVRLLYQFFKNMN